MLQGHYVLHGPTRTLDDGRGMEVPAGTAVVAVWDERLGGPVARTRPRSPQDTEDLLPVVIEADLYGITPYSEMPPVSAGICACHCR